MTKTRFTALDVAAAVNSLRIELRGMRLNNIYDVDNKTYLLKFSKPEGKLYLIIESGCRLHLTTFSHEKSDIPSVFTMKIRRHCRTKRLESVRQLGMDRIVHFTFGTGEGAFHLILELFAKGNIILTDWTGKILTLLRTHKYSEDYEVRTGSLYRFADAQPIPEVAMETLKSALEKAEAKENIVNVLGTSFNFSNTLLEHCVRAAGLSPKLVPTKNPLSEENVQKLFTALVEGHQMLVKLRTGEEIARGFLILKDPAAEKAKKEGDGSSNNNDNNAAAAATEEVVDEARAERLRKVATYDEFSPILFLQFQTKKYDEFDTFHKCVDEFFTGMDQAKQVKEVGERDKHVDKKVDKARKDQLMRVNKLEEQELSNQEMARLIELNLNDVDQAITIIRSGLDSGMDWNHLNHVVKQEQRSGNAIASLIHALHLDRNSMSLLLNDPFDDGECQSKVVEVDLELTAYANVRKYYETMKKVKDKKEKTLAVTEGVVNRATKKAEKAAGEIRQKVTIQSLRKVHWWEKFNWCITSDGYVVIAGRDAQQNELLVKRYMRKGDVYVHAEVHGAASCIIKAKTTHEQEIPVDTLAQAGMMTVCRSHAWTSKVPADAWWVHPDQVSKTAPTGEYLVTGSFMIRGKKNPLPSANLTMGIAILFRITPDSAAKNHKDDHLKRSLEASGGEWQHDADDDTDDDQDGSGDGDEDEEETVGAIDPKFQLQISVESTALLENEKKQEQQPEAPKKEEKEEEHEEEEEEEEGGQNAQEGKKGKMSVAERKRLKKLKQKLAAEGVDPNSVVAPPPKAEPPVASKPKQKQQDVGKKKMSAKEKKKAQKYKDQTPEERALMEKILRGGKNINLDDDNEEDGKEKVEMAAGLKDLLEQDEGGEAVHGTRAGRRAAEKQEIAAILEEEKIQAADQMMMSGDESELATLTGDPRPDDEILYAMYMCAPWPALQGFKYKLKVVPGPPGKKSKVANQVMSLFAKQAQHTGPRELEFIKMISEEELLHLIPPSSRLLVGLAGPAKKGGAKKKGGKRRAGANKRANRNK